jgi:uncharacterized protein (DUF779 family)
MTAMKRSIQFLILALLTGCSDLIVTGPEEHNNFADFESAWHIVGSVYPYFQFKHINWDSVYTVYRPRAEAAKGDEIDGVLFDMLRELRDGHVRLQSRGGASVATYTPPRADKDRYAYSPLVVRKYFDRELLLAGDQRIEYGIIGGDIGYIYVATLRREEPVADGFDEALSYVKETKGLIIDVRHNGGGSDDNSMAVVTRLISSPFDILPSPAPGGGLNHGPYIYPRGSFHYTDPVVLLIDGVCFSSCEDFAEMMKHVPTVIAIGDTTGGGSGAPELFTLPSGREINVSTKDIRRYDGLPIEWNGVPPDILVRQTAEDIKLGRDKQLEYAIDHLREPRPR